MEEQEGVRVYELDWFKLPVLNIAEITFNFGHLPTEMKYADHFRFNCLINDPQLPFQTGQSIFAFITFAKNTSFLK